MAEWFYHGKESGVRETDGRRKQRRRKENKKNGRLFSTDSFWIKVDTKKYESTSQLFFNYDCVNHHFRNSDDYTNPLIRRVKMVVAIAVIIGRKTELARR